MNNYLCPFCQQHLNQTVIQEFGKGIKLFKELSYSCEYLPCKEQGPQKVSRWYFECWENHPINYYRAHLSINDKHYIVRGTAAGAWTKLYYDIPALGAMMQSSILNLPYTLPQEPLSDFLQHLLKKMLNYIVFS